MTIQQKNQTQLTGGISIIKYKQHNAPIIGIIENLCINVAIETAIKIQTYTKNKNS